LLGQFALLDEAISCPSGGSRLSALAWRGAYCLDMQLYFYESQSGQAFTRSVDPGLRSTPERMQHMLVVALNKQWCLF
jgi:hypothetical protein